MKKNFVMIDKNIGSKQMQYVTNVFSKHNGLLNGEYWIFNDISFIKALVEIKSQSYNLDCTSDRPARDMIISEKKQIDPPILPEDPFVKHSELRKILQEELSSFVTRTELQTILKEELSPFVTRAELQAMLKEELNKMPEWFKVWSAEIFVPTIKKLEARMDQNGLKPYIESVT